MAFVSSIDPSADSHLQDMFHVYIIHIYDASHTYMTDIRRRSQPYIYIYIYIWLVCGEFSCISSWQGACACEILLAIGATYPGPRSGFRESGRNREPCLETFSKFSGHSLISAYSVKFTCEPYIYEPYTKNKTVRDPG